VADQKFANLLSVVTVSNLRKTLTLTCRFCNAVSFNALDNKFENANLLT